MLFSSILFGTGLVQLGLAAYTLKDDYSPDNFASMFRFDTMDDPTHGYVNYVDQNTAQSSGLYSVQDGQVIIGVDHQNKASGRGRDSVRLTSNAAYNHGLVVIDLAHMPGSICGSWPAFWMTGPNWPNSGEIDILEGVNSQSQNQMTMHTGPGCTLVDQNCQGNLGCSVKGGAYGDNFNSGGGGVYAMEWTSNAINLWFFARGSIPSDINDSAPDPSAWGNPTAQFNGGSGCDIDSHFRDNNIVFDTTFCGDWAGNVFSEDGTCASKASSCQDFVQNNPEAFKESYWAVNSLKVYEGDASGSPTEGPDAGPSSPLATSVAQPTFSAPVSAAPSFFLQTTLPSAPVFSINASSTAFPINPTPGFPIPSANQPTPTEPVVMVTQTVTGDFVATHTIYPSHAFDGQRGGRHRGGGGRHNGAVIPEKRMVHRAARHLAMHQKGERI